MKKKLLLLFAVLATAINASAYDFEVDGFYYNTISLEDLTCEVTYKDDNYQSYSGDITTPSTVTYKGKTFSVIKIGNRAFYCCSNLKSVEIPSSVTEIGWGAFGSSSSLTSVEIPNSVNTIGSSAFANCSSLTSVVIPSSITLIEGSAFYACTSLTSVEIPNSVTTIRGKAFYGCTSLTSVEIPNSVTKIVDEAFRECSSLISIAIGKSVETIGRSAFYACTSLTSVEIPGSVTSIGEKAFYFCKNLTSLAIGKSVETIGNSAFASTSISDYFCDNEKYVDLFIGIKNLTFGENVNTIDHWSTGPDLENITIKNNTPPTFTFSYFSDPFTNKQYMDLNIYVPEDVIDKYKTADVWKKFWNIVGLNGEEGGDDEPENYILYTSSDGEVVTPHDENAFDATITSNTYADGQGKIVFDGEVTSIGECAFKSCSSLTSVEIPNSVKTIDTWAFEGCSSLTSVEIPNSVETIRGYAFRHCSKLTSVEIPNSVTTIGGGAFWDCSSLTSVKIPNSITEIEFDTFIDCSNLTSVEIPNSVTTIGEDAFAGCSSLASVEIPNSVTSIEGAAFAGCSSLTSVEIPNSVIKIGSEAFVICSALTSVTVENDNPANITLGSSVFSNVPTSTCILYVPNGSKELYAAADQWKDFANIEEIIGGSVTLVDGETYAGAVNKNNVDVTYTRTFSSTDWQPLYVPFNMSYDEWSEYGRVAELACVHVYEDGKTAIEFVTVNSGELLPNVPYVIMPNAEGEVTFTCSGKQLKAAPAEGEKYISCSSPRYIFKLFGNYQPISASTLAGYGDPEFNGAYVMTAENKFSHASDGEQLNPYRFYITREKNPNGYWNAPARHNMPATSYDDTDVIYFMVDGQVTGILSVSNNSGDDVKVYDLNGIESRNPHNGVFIKNGKKVYIK